MKSLEVSLLTEGVYRRYGYDFRNYIPTFLESRIEGFARAENCRSVSDLQARVLHDADCMERMAEALTFGCGALFSDAGFFLAFRKKIAPLLKTYPFIRIWVPACATGEDAYSLAILLDEEGALERTHIYATELSLAEIQKAKAGRFPMGRIMGAGADYLKAGGKGEFSKYFAIEGETAVMADALRSRVAFAQHSLATDGPFNEFNAIVCRNCLAYFNNTLQDKVHDLFHASLPTFGVLALGKKDSIRYTSHESSYECLDPEERLYRKVR